MPKSAPAFNASFFLSSFPVTVPIHLFLVYYLEFRQKARNISARTSWHSLMFTDLGHSSCALHHFLLAIDIKSPGFPVAKLLF